MEQRQAPRRRVSIVLIVFLFTVCLLIASFLIAFKYTTHKTKYAYNAGAEQEDVSDANFERKGKWYGLCAKNSIHSVDDFRKTVSNDPVLKTHYADFRWENAEMGRLDQATLAYVYFRKDDKILLTKKPIRLPAGDEYITDGYTRVRTFCCNNYTVAPPFKDSPDLLAELSTNPSLYEPPVLPVEPSAGLPAQQSPEQMSPVSPYSVQLPPPLEENVLRWREESPFFASISKESGYGETTLATQPEDPSAFTSIPQEYGYGGNTTFPQSYPTPTSTIPDDGGGGTDGGGGGPKPIPEAATILLVGVGVAVSFIVFFIGNYYNRKNKTPGHRT